uniref:C-type lectin domain-containing protein n=1 Tax=Seriola lalandi dorsalis TaxID=1841481 RepID=A0A3B4Z6H9_SERLL
LNLDCKVLTKVLATRLQVVLPSIIHPYQVGFMKNRTSTDNIRLLLHLMWLSQSQSVPITAISLDAEKAFDRVEWPFSALRWLYFNGSLYYNSSNEKTWQESRKDCIQKGADLTIINNREEQKYLWIGLTDIETEGKWKWVDGTPLTRSFWDSKEPNGKTLENCGQIKNPNLQNNWNDERCSNTHNWICEEKVSL